MPRQAWSYVTACKFKIVQEMLTDLLELQAQQQLRMRDGHSGGKWRVNAP